MRQKAILQVEAISKYYGANNAIKDVSFQVNNGEIFGIIGKNGAGKTTLLELIMGLKMPDAGTIKLFGLDATEDAKKIKEDIGIYMQSTSLVDRMTVREALEMFQSFYTRYSDVEVILNTFGLEAYADKIVKRLSGGLRQRAMLAIAVVNDPKIIFLDEPTTGLDLQTKKEYWALLRALKQQGKTIVIASHDMEEIQRKCDRVCVLNNGNLVICNHPSSLIAELPGGGLTMEAVYMHYAVYSQGGVII